MIYPYGHALLPALFHAVIEKNKPMKNWSDFNLLLSVWNTSQL